MKRGPTLLVIVCILLLIPGFILGARNKPTHLLWNMPFGLEKDSFLARLEDNTNEFIVIHDENNENIIAFLIKGEDRLHFMEYPVDVAFLFSSGLYSEAQILFRYDQAYIDELESQAGVSGERADMHLQKTLRVYFDLLAAMNAQHRASGEPFILSENDTEKLAIPRQSNETDREEIARLLESKKTASLSVQYDNISVVIDKSVSIIGEKQSPMYFIYMCYEGDM